MHDTVYPNHGTDHFSGSAHSPARRAERLDRLYSDLVAKFGPDHSMVVRVRAQRDAARTLAGLDGEVRP